MTMDEIIRSARREVWGPMPGDPDHEEIEYDLSAGRRADRISLNALAGRIQRGSIPGESGAASGTSPTSTSPGTDSWGSAAGFVARDWTIFMNGFTKWRSFLIIRRFPPTGSAAFLSAATSALQRLSEGRIPTVLENGRARVGAA